jgi:uncharacterized protein
MTKPWDPPPFATMAPFWEAAERHVLSAPWCDTCQRPVLYPRELCPRCHAATPTWRSLSGRGEVYAYAVEHRRIDPDMDLEPPYVVALVELEEGARLLTNIVGPADDEGRLRVGAAVEVLWHKRPDGRTIPRFQLAP